MKRLLIGFLGAALIMAPQGLAGQGFSIAGIAGTTGIGGSVILGLAPKINFRTSVGVIPGNPSINVDGVDYDLDTPTLILSTLDFYPLGGFHISAGGLIVSKSGDFDVMGRFAGKSVSFNNVFYTGAPDDVINGTFSLKSVQPYVGIGFGNPLGKRVGINLDLGVGFGDKPDVDLSATGTLASDPIVGPQFLADLNAEEATIRNDIPDYLRYFPVISISISIGLGL